MYFVEALTQNMYREEDDFAEQKQGRKEKGTGWTSPSRGERNVHRGGGMVVQNLPHHHKHRGRLAPAWWDSHRPPAPQCVQTGSLGLGSGSVP